MMVLDNLFVMNTTQRPKFRYAVYSSYPGDTVADLESSFDDVWQARRLFEKCYATWGIPNQTFALVDTDTNEVMMLHSTGRAEA